MKQNEYNQIIISSKNKSIYYDNQLEKFLDNNKFLSNQKIITISPGGLKGFYLLGVVSFIKENYNLNNYIFSGVSAGSWISLFMCYKGNSKSFLKKILDNVQKSKSILEIEHQMKNNFLKNYNTNDFDLMRLFIGVTIIKNFKKTANIFTNFENLEDAIECCIASSHIPFITGKMTNKYHNIYTFDGAFSEHPYLMTGPIIFHITPDMWKDREKNTEKNTIKNIIHSLSIQNICDHFAIANNNLFKLYDEGYNDAKKNKKILDKIFYK
jgi:hypothetical protein